jgi:hypothetical protein
MCLHLENEGKRYYLLFLLTFKYLTLFLIQTKQWQALAKATQKYEIVLFFMVYANC